MSFFVTSATPFLWHLSPLFSDNCHPQNYFKFSIKFFFFKFWIIFKFEYQTIMLEVVMDLVVNEVIDNELDKEMTKVVEEVNKK